MDLAGWEARYRSEPKAEDLEPTPATLVTEQVEGLKPGRALDLACGSGRNALWLARRGWQVTAFDGAPSAIATLETRAEEAEVRVDARTVDLTSPEFVIERNSWDLILDCYYLNRGLFKPMQDGVRPGGMLISIVHTTQGNEEPTETRLRPRELSEYFQGWEIVHRYEGASRDAAHKRPVAEIAARKLTCDAGEPEPDRIVEV